MKFINNVIISNEAWNFHFECDYDACKGLCCKYGDMGAPITKAEEVNLQENLQNLEPYLTKRNFNSLEDGISSWSLDGLHIKELGRNVPCPFSFYVDNNKLACSAHAYCLDNGLPITSIKPKWCAAYPLIIRKLFNGFTFITLGDIPDICVPKANSKRLLIANLPILEEIFGKSWAESLKKAISLSESGNISKD